MISVRLKSSSSHANAEPMKEAFLSKSTPPPPTHAQQLFPPPKKTTNDDGVILCEQRDERKATDQPVDDTEELFYIRNGRIRSGEGIWGPFVTCPVALIVVPTG